MKNGPFQPRLDPSDPLESNNTETILDSFRYFKGRRYHNLADVTYYLPNDDKEAERENLQHNLYKFIWKNNFSSPVHELLKSGKAKVLDIGCGTGLWLLDMAKDYPQATFVGIDMSPIFPNVKSIPSNVVFLQHNLNDGIPFPDETFDFVFQRFLCNCVLFEKWKFYVKEMIRITKPSGWLEFFEFDQSQHKEDTNSFHQQVLDSATSRFKAKGINSRPQFCVPAHLEECQGLSKVHCKEKHTPAGDRAEQLGVMMKTYSAMNAEAIKLLLASAWGVDDETYDSIVARTALEFDRYGIHIKSFRWFSKKI